MSLRADSARVRGQMLAAARRRIETGDLDLPMNAVAKDAAVGVGTVYRHFPTRQELIEALAADSMARLATAAADALGAPDPGGALERFLAAALRGLAADPALSLVLGSSEAVRAETLECGDSIMSSLNSLLARAKTAGVVRADVTPDDLRALVCGVHHAVGVIGTDEADRYLRFLMKGLKP